MDKSITENYIFYKCIVTSLVIVVMVSGELFSFFKNYMSLIIHDMLLLHRILIQYCISVSTFIIYVFCSSHLNTRYT